MWRQNQMRTPMFIRSLSPPVTPTKKRQQYFSKYLFYFHIWKSDRLEYSAMTWSSSKNSSIWCRQGWHSVFPCKVWFEARYFDWGKYSITNTEFCGFFATCYYLQAFSSFIPVSYFLTIHTVFPRSSSPYYSFS